MPRTRIESAPRRPSSRELMPLDRSTPSGGSRLHRAARSLLILCISGPMVAADAPDASGGSRFWLDDQGRGHFDHEVLSNSAANSSASAHDTVDGGSSESVWPSVSWSPNVLVGPETLGRASVPSIATADGRIVGIADVQVLATKSQLIYYLSTDGGDTWSSSETVVETLNSEWVRWPKLRMTPSGEAAVVWQDNRRDAAYADVYFSLRSPGPNGTWSPPARVNTSNSPEGLGTPAMPTVEHWRGKHFVVAWSHYVNYQGEVHIRSTTDSGVTWSVEVNATPTVDPNQTAEKSALVIDPYLSIERSAPFLCLASTEWRSGDSFSDVYSYRSTDGGLTWSAGVRINDIFVYQQLVASHSMVVPSPGVVGVLWEYSDFNQDDARFSLSTDGGSTWGSSHSAFPVGVPRDLDDIPRVVLVDGWLWTVLAIPFVPPTTDALCSVSTDGGSTWGAVGTLLNDSQDEIPIQIDIAATDRYRLHVVWVDGSLNPQKLFATHGIPNAASVPGVQDEVAFTRPTLLVTPNPCARADLSRLRVRLMGERHARFSVGHEWGRDSGEFRVRVVNASGRRYMEVPWREAVLSEVGMPVDLTRWPTGYYFVQLTEGDRQVATGSFVLSSVR